MNKLDELRIEARLLPIDTYIERRIEARSGFKHSVTIHRHKPDHVVLRDSPYFETVRRTYRTLRSKRYVRQVPRIHDKPTFVMPLEIIPLLEKVGYEIDILDISQKGYMPTP